MNPVQRFGVLRCLLFLAVLALVALAPFTGGPPEYAGFGLVKTVVGPACFAMALFALPLDMTMTRVLMVDKRGAERARYRQILWAEAALFCLLIASWAPLLIKLLRLANG